MAITKTHLLASLAVCCLLAMGGFYVGVAYAADRRFDQATDMLNKAIVTLEAADNPGVKPPFGGHREAAVEHIKKAMKQIEQAKKWADTHPPKRR